MMWCLVLFFFLSLSLSLSLRIFVSLSLSLSLNFRFIDFTCFFLLRPNELDPFEIFKGIVKNLKQSASKARQFMFLYPVFLILSVLFGRQNTPVLLSAVHCITMDYEKHVVKMQTLRTGKKERATETYYLKLISTKLWAWKGETPLTLVYSTPEINFQNAFLRMHCPPPQFPTPLPIPFPQLFPTHLSQFPHFLPPGFPSVLPQFPPPIPTYPPPFPDLTFLPTNLEAPLILHNKVSCSSSFSSSRATNSPTPAKRVRKELCFVEMKSYQVPVTGNNLNRYSREDLTVTLIKFTQNEPNDLFNNLCTFTSSVGIFVLSYNTSPKNTMAFGCMYGRFMLASATN